MTTTTEQSHSDKQKQQVPSQSSIVSGFANQDEEESESMTLQPIVSHQSLDTAMTEGEEATEAPTTIQQEQTASPTTMILAPVHASLSNQQLNESYSTSVPSTSSVPNTNTVPEFLYQLTKMLTDNNRDIIEWSNGKIEVHNPHKLQTHVLNRYFRHSKFASFQRQLNYFGFRKLAGKGKMAPCSYVNDATTKELGSLLTIKRKVGNEPKTSKKRERGDSTSTPDGEGNEASQRPAVNPILANILYRSSATDTTRQPLVTAATRSNVHDPPNRSQQEIARVAVGKGIRHSFSLAKKPAPLSSHSAPSLAPTNSTTTPSSAASKDTAVVVQAGLSALTHNFKSSLEAVQGEQTSSVNGDSGDDSYPLASYVPGSMRRDDSLVDLAMIPVADDDTPSSDYMASSGLTFIDFPWQDPSMFPGG